MNRDILVYVDVAGTPTLCGRLWTRSLPREGASFEYAEAWRKHPRAFSLDPDLPLDEGRSHTALAIFRAFTDPAPDRWGQTLLRRAERAQARREGRPPRALTAVDFLLLVDDETRLGALRFQEASSARSGTFLATGGKRVPPLVELPRLLGATARIVADEETDEDLTLLLAPGTSLGGARPKASVRHPDGALLVAKFPSKNDEWPITRWEATTLSLARGAGIRVPAFRLELVAKKPVLLLDRFDRQGSVRIPFMSAMTALSAEENQPHSYLELAEVLRQGGSEPEEDLRELWRRLAFNVLVSNTDDHLRNHGFLHDGVGWRLAPAYDLNPMPPDVRPRVHALALDEEDPTASMETAFAVAPRFGIIKAEAGRIAREVASSVKTWRAEARRSGLSPRELERMEAAFEHEDLARAAK
ncbi:MAG: HipA domain-containing protein [Deltaproteobacteria bacterium]|nr:HipA domain-containing protein [Deltaproteobacteria bacterium]